MPHHDSRKRHASIDAEKRRNELINYEPHTDAEMDRGLEMMAQGIPFHSVSIRMLVEQCRRANALAAAMQTAKKLDADWHAVMDSNLPVAEFNAQIGRLHDEIQAQRAKIDQALAAYLGEGPDSEGS